MRAGVSKPLSGEANAFQSWDGRVPVILGVTGHRNIDTSSKKLIEALRRECRSLRRAYRDCPFIILSALAEGADRLAAQVAMDELQAALIAVLPMPEEEYERDFGTEESKSEFRAFLDRALYVKTVSVPAGDRSWTADGEPRNVQYARAGAIIVGHAQILFAIWDGLPARGTGGTAGQVEWFERGYSPKEYSVYRNASSPLDPPEPGLRIRIDPATAEVSRKVGPDLPSGTRSNIAAILKRTNRYNRDVIRRGGTIKQESPLAAEAAGNFKDLAIADSVYRVSDGLSVLFAKSVRGADSVIYILTFLAVIFSNFITQNDYAIWIYLGITCIMALLASQIWFRSIDNRFFEYRSLAEAMRTLFFWRNAGVTRPVWLGYLSRQPGVVHWIRHAVRSLEFCQDCHLAPAKNAETNARPDGIRVTKAAWVDDQKRWFERKEREHFRLYMRWAMIARLALAASILTAIVLMELTMMPNESGGFLSDEWVKPETYGNYWQMVFGVFAAIELAARDRRAQLELAKQYAAQRQIFEAASRLLDTNGSEREWSDLEILERLGEETLQAQAEWLWRAHTRPFELPTV